MLSQAALRSLRTPGVRTAPIASRIASAPRWSRSLATGRGNRPNPNTNPNNPPKKPTEYSRPAGISAQKGPGGASAAFNTPQQTTRSTDSKKPEYSKKQDEVDARATPERNTIPQSEGTGAGKLNPEGGKQETPDVSGKQEEFNTSAASSENTAPQATSPSAIDPAEVPPPNYPLPDLTQGIPSTLEYETTGRVHKSPLNLTEAEQEEGASGGGRGRGELPASAYVSSTEKKRLLYANIAYLLFAILAGTGTVYCGRNWDTEEEEKAHPDTPSGWSVGLMWNRARARLDDYLGYYKDPAFKKLLPDTDPMFERPYTLVFELEDLLVHSEWTREHGWRMAKRPGVDYFLRYLSQYYELVLFTTQPSAMAEAVVRKLDPFHIITWPLFREGTLYEGGDYVKDLSYLNRPLSKVIMIDNKAHHAKNQPENTILLKPWKGDPKDNELVALIPFLEYLHVMNVPDVRKTLEAYKGTHIPTEFAAREAVARQKFHEALAEEQKKRPKHSGVGFLGRALGIKHQTQMMDPNDQSPAEAFAQGKMLQDQARERGQRTYAMLEKEIRENGAKWLAEEAAFEEKAKAETTKAMKSGMTGWFGSGKSE